MTFLNSILNNSKKYESPFNHWEYNNALSDEAIKEIENADIPDISKHNLNYDGTRAIDGCLLYTSPSPRDMRRSRMPSSA